MNLEELIIDCRKQLDELAELLIEEEEVAGDRVLEVLELEHGEKASA